MMTGCGCGYGPWGTADQPIPIQIGRVQNLASLPTPVLRTILFITQGDNLDVFFRAYRDVVYPPDCSGGCGPCNPDFPFGIGSGPQILTGLIGAGTIRTALGVPFTYDLDVFVDQTGAGSPTRGNVQVTASGVQTRLFPGFGVWDLQISNNTDNLRKTLVEGPIEYTRVTTLTPNPI